MGPQRSGSAAARLWSSWRRKVTTPVLSVWGQLDAPGGGAGPQLGVDPGVERGSQHPVDRSRGAGPDLAAQVGHEALDVGPPRLGELDVTEPRNEVAADRRHVTSQGGGSLVQRVRCAPFLEPLGDGDLGVERGMHDRAPHHIGLGQRQPPAGLCSGRKVPGAGLPSGNRA
jgi:hypothetical protein